MRSVLPFDELNKFVTVTLPAHFDASGRIKSKKDEEDIIDELLDLFLLAYAMGNDVTNASLSSDWKPTLDEVMETIDKKVAGKTWRERISEYFDKARKGEIPAVSREDMERRLMESGAFSGQRGQTEAGVSDTTSGGISLQDAIVRIAETETHRDANTAALETATRAGATSKTWMTMLDDRVRDTHVPLEGVSVPIDAEFYTWDGDHAQAPGLFEFAENNINCRCELLFE